MNRKILLVTLSLLGCEVDYKDNSRGMCRTFDLCLEDEGVTYTCNEITFWYECNDKVLDRCEWKEFDKNKSEDNSLTSSCSDCLQQNCYN